MDDIQISDLLSSFRRRLMATPMEFYRYLYQVINWKDSLIGIKGPKGCGKTTLILQHIKACFPGAELDKVLYVSLDNIWFTTHRLVDLVEYHYNNRGTHLFIDEIHYEPKWQTLLKNFSDDFPGLNIVYTGSSMLQIQAGEGDLSRRQAMYEMRGLSFREFLEYEGVFTMKSIDINRLLADHVGLAMEICEKLKVLPLFKKYLKEGYYPFYKSVNNGVENRLLAVVNQVIENDYPQIDVVTPETIRKTKKMLMVLAERVPQLPNMSVLYRELDTDRNNGLKMLHALERGGLLMLLSDHAKSPNNLSRPEKIYINNTTLMFALTPRADVGTMRETFFMNQLSAVGDICYPAKGDFLVDGKYLFEVGGKNKTFAQIADIPNSFLAVDDTEVGHGSRIPLWMFGMLY